MFTIITRLINIISFSPVFVLFAKYFVVWESPVFICLGYFTVCFHMSCALKFKGQWWCRGEILSAGKVFTQLHKSPHFLKLKNGDRVGWLDGG